MDQERIKMQNEQNPDFIQGVSRYFKDFLETDFHRRRKPKRSIKTHNNDNLLIGLSLAKYPAFNALVWQAFNSAFETNNLKPIPKGTYSANIPHNILTLIRNQAEHISPDQVNIILNKASEAIQRSVEAHAKDYDQALIVSLGDISSVMKKNLVTPLLISLENSLERLGLGDENSIYHIEEELTDSLIDSLFEGKVSDIIQSLLMKDYVNIPEELKQVFDLEEIRNTIVTFFEAFKARDLFLDMNEMEKNKHILNKQDFYFYFFDITFNHTTYPIFYIPFSLSKQFNTFYIETDARVYINKKAIEYIVQQYNKDKRVKGSLRTISERIIYLSQIQSEFPNVVNNVIQEIINFFELDTSIDISDSKLQKSKGLWVSVSNSCHAVLFDKSDEALVNDYEEIEQKLNKNDAVLFSGLNTLIKDFIHKNPINFESEIGEKWDRTGTLERLVFNSPIPLNAEQLQILSAIKKDDCKYTLVEGPPGTGKSHTITAVIFDAILQDQSVLVLSDTKEALDVVEQKITEAINKVRFDENFQNPILRLGKTGNTYNKILATSSIQDIKTQYRAVRNDEIKNRINKLAKSLRNDLEKEISSYQDINIHEIYELLDLETPKNDIEKIIDLEELIKEQDSEIEIEKCKNIFDKIKQELFSKDHIKEALKEIGVALNDIDSLGKLQLFIEELAPLVKTVGNTRNNLEEKIRSNLPVFDRLTTEDFHYLRNLLVQYKGLKHPWFGYFLQGKQIKELDQKFKSLFPTTKIDSPRKHITQLETILDMVFYINRAYTKYPTDTKTDHIRIIYFILCGKKGTNAIQELITLKKDLDYLEQSITKYPRTFKKLGVRLSKLKTLMENSLIEMSNSDLDQLIRYLYLKRRIEAQFIRVPDLDYNAEKKHLEELVTKQMTHIMDGRLVQFYDQHRNDARMLKSVIRKKQRFPKDEFSKLKEAFPCILAGIRDYAEYIPLEPEIFDLVIIDEASQVSIAQAFPALLRARKILILGDRKQFSNVKSAHAKTETNREYLSELKHIFKRNVSTDLAKLEKLEKLNIKTSILEFIEFISNYHTRLLKYFRGYKEIISYSNKHFYQDSLQTMKIRAKHIDDVLKFSFLNHDGKMERIRNTNTPEAEFIIDELKKIKETGECPSVCIITPHTNQQKFLMEKISNLYEGDYYFEKFKLKIFTFDTCQGEERDIVFYSMVATRESDRLWGVFIKDLGAVDIEEDGKIKAQRLNVGFSRAKECMHFVLSKPLDEYAGSIGQALRHYYHILGEARKEPSSDEVDPNSPQEKKALHWIIRTKFWQDNSPQNVSLNPQFELGKYLKQLNPTYNHPNYKVDFLLIYKEPENDTEHKIIIEYDGFEAHFKNRDEVNEYNYEQYYSDDDIYRQKVLESYGYKFLRINRFNIGKDPISVLNKRLEKLVQKQDAEHEFLSDIREKTQGLQSNEMRKCSRCKKIKKLDDFKDNTLTTGYGRICKQCKGIA